LNSGAPMKILSGLGVSDGIAIGKAVCIETRVVEVYRFPIAEAEVESEVERLREAVRRTEAEIRSTRRNVGTDLGEDLAAIFDAHVLMLADSTFIDRIVGRIRDERVNAEWVVHRTTEELAARFAGMADARLRERADDLQDVGRYLLRVLQGIAHHELSEIEGDVVIVADDLTPSDAVRLGRQRVVGFAIETGGRTSHTTIIARSLNIPLVTGLSGVIQLVTDEDPVIVDGGRGRPLLHPTADALAEHRTRRSELHSRESRLLLTRDLPTVTRDGVAIHLMANIDLPEEIEEAGRFGAAGVGLYRSEFLYIECSPVLPSEEAHVEIYERLAAASAPHPAIIRTYDLGGRKLAREVMDTREENPVLGLRGIRLTMARPQVFRTQIRALLRAAVHGNLWIMLPLVSGIEEVRQFRAFAAAMAAELADEGLAQGNKVPLGVMIEVPSAAMTADILAREVDFFSIGTNDLIQYALAVDRNNEHVAPLYQPLHPGLLRMIRFVVESAEEAGIEVSVCGEMASDPRYAPLLVGMGLRRLSMSPRMVPAIKTQLRGQRMSDLRELARGSLLLTTAAEIEAFVQERLPAVSADQEIST
jgi:phosphoenolpyruvate-protein phosphotransferase (PTS system enzyme I)